MTAFHLNSPHDRHPPCSPKDLAALAEAFIQLPAHVRLGHGVTGHDEEEEEKNEDKTAAEGDWVGGLNPAYTVCTSLMALEGE